MKSNTFWIIVAGLAILAIVSFFFSYWPVGVGLAIVVVALLTSRGLQSNRPKPTE
jgi:hypothetical protein